MKKDKKDQTEGIKEIDDLFENDPPKDIDPNKDNKSEKEQENLFGFKGPYSNFEEYMRHEDFIIRKLNSQSERKLREDNANKAFKFSSKWAIFIAIIIILKGFGFFIQFELSQTEFLFVIGSLTSSILLFYTLVIRYLFDRPNDNGKDKK